jgi:cephalosporin-C deacetylase-like acetyl esterase
MPARPYLRTDADFLSHGTRCAAWLFRPHHAQRPPVVVMAHGFGGIRCIGLPALAETFTTYGLAALVFDYRTFGDSDGQPRQYINPFRHLQDWRAAVAHARTLPEVDGARLGLWGTSFSAGHALITAARDAAVRALVLQVPFVEPFSTIRRVRRKMAALWAGVRDLLRAVTCRAPYTMRIVGEPHEVAGLNMPGAKQRFLSLVPKTARWTNACPARVALMLPFYRPIAYARRVRVPALMLLAEEDNIVSRRAAQTAAARMADVQVIHLPGDHFTLYEPENVQRAAALAGEFFARHLGSVPT